MTLNVVSLSVHLSKTGDPSNEILQQLLLSMFSFRCWLRLLVITFLVYRFWRLRPLSVDCSADPHQPSVLLLLDLHPSSDQMRCYRMKCWHRQDAALSLQ